MEVFCTDIQNAGKHSIESTKKTVENRQIIKFFSTNNQSHDSREKSKVVAKLYSKSQMR
jgi:hypothetical protein